MKLTIVIPARNEEDSLPRTIKGLMEHIKPEHDILIVDDYSIDHTPSIAREFEKRYRNIRLVKNDAQPGFTNAIKKGFSKVKEGAVALVMADCCDDPQTINRMYEKINEGYDIVCGSRYMEGGKREGRLIQGFFSRFVNFVLYHLWGIPTHDSSNAFKMYRKNVLEAIDIEEAGFASSLEMTVKAFIKRFKITEVPTKWKKRESGTSKFRMSSAARNYIYWFVWLILKGRSRKISPSAR